MIRQLLEGCAPRADLQIAVFAELSASLVSLRAMMQSVSKESKVSQKELEDIQRCHRALLSGVEMLAAASAALTGAPLHPEVRQAFLAQGRKIRRSLVSMARALRSRSAWPSDVVAFDARPFHAETPMMPVELHGPYWLLAQIATQCAALDRVSTRST